MSMRCVVIVLLGLALCAPAGAQPAAKNITADQVMDRLAEGFAAIADLTVTLEAEVNMERLRVPRMSVTMHFKTPDRVQFVSEGFAMIPREGILVNPALLRSRYEASLVDEDVINGRNCYRLRLTARDADLRQRQLIIWVDPEHWTLARTESIPYEGRSVTIDFAYGRVQDRYWLPARTTAVFTSSGEDTLGHALQPDLPMAQQFSEIRRPMRSGTITVRYSGYVVNSGLSDNLFRSQQED